MLNKINSIVLIVGMLCARLWAPIEANLLTQRALHAAKEAVDSLNVPEHIKQLCKQEFDNISQPVMGELARSHLNQRDSWQKLFQFATDLGKRNSYSSQHLEYMLRQQFQLSEDLCDRHYDLGMSQVRIARDHFVRILTQTCEEWKQQAIELNREITALGDQNTVLQDRIHALEAENAALRAQLQSEPEREPAEAGEA